MNKKGYSLLEILIVIAIVVTIGVLATINLDKILGDSKTDKYNALIQDIKEATNTYITIYEEELSISLETLYNNGTSFNVDIETLQDALLLDEILIDPRNNKIIDGVATIVTVGYSSQGEGVLTFTLSEIAYKQ